MKNLEQPDLRILAQAQDLIVKADDLLRTVHFSRHDYEQFSARIEAMEQLYSALKSIYKIATGKAYNGKDSDSWHIEGNFTID